VTGSGDTNRDVVDRAKAALEGVTPGPWNRHDFGHGGESEPSSIVVYAGEKFDWQAIYDGDFVFSTCAWDAQQDADAHFACAARSLVPELVAELETAQKQVKALIDIVEHTGNDGKVPWSYIVAAWNALGQPSSGLS
jgi:hypothetical protein